MSLMNDGNNGGMVMPVSPMIGGGYGYGDGFGGGGFFWLLVIFVIAFMGNGFGFGGFGGNAGTTMVNNDLQRGFDQQAVMGGLNGITASVNGISQQLCNGFAQAEIAANSRQMADMNQAFAAQTALTQGLNTLAMNQQNCCCENRAAVADLKYTVATEACADRAAVTQALQEVTAQNNANTQRILDQMCQDRYDNLKVKYDDLQRELTAANLAASQTAQTAKILADNAAQTQALEQYLNPAPIPAYAVQNPNCCSNGCGNRFIA